MDYEKVIRKIIEHYEENPDPSTISLLVQYLQDQVILSFAQKSDKLYAVFEDDHENGFYDFVALFDSLEKLLQEVAKEKLKENNNFFVGGAKLAIMSLQVTPNFAVYKDYVVKIWPNNQIDKLLLVVPWNLNEYGVLE